MIFIGLNFYLMDKLTFLEERHSVRSYSDVPLTKSQVRALEAEITFINTHEAGLYFSLVTGDNAPFKGFTASYGFFKGVHSYIVAVIDESYPNTKERAGYFGQQLVVKALESGLSTCFVGGTFSEKRVDVQLRAGRKVLYLITIGKDAVKKSFVSDMVSKLAHKKQWNATDMFEPVSDLSSAIAKFPDLERGLKAILCAPSALNRKPVRITINQEGMLTAFVKEESGYNLIDLGIAKFNFQYVMGGSWEFGNGAPFLPD